MTTTDDRLWAKVSYDEPSKCWLWTGSLTKSGGYAQFRLDGHPVRVHVLMLELSLGRPLLPGMCSLHSCDTPACVSPEHLFEGTRRDNNKDRDAKGRGRWPGPRVPLRGERHPNSKITDQQAAEIRALHHVVSGAELASRYGVRRGLIYRVQAGRR